jgi:hypothetical protein
VSDAPDHAPDTGVDPLAEDRARALTERAGLIALYPVAFTVAGILFVRAAPAGGSAPVGTAKVGAWICVALAWGSTLLVYPWIARRAMTAKDQAYPRTVFWGTVGFLYLVSVFAMLVAGVVLGV